MVQNEKEIEINKRAYSQGRVVNISGLGFFKAESLILFECHRELIVLLVYHKSPSNCIDKSVTCLLALKTFLRMLCMQKAGMLYSMNRLFSDPDESLCLKVGMTDLFH